MIAELKAGASPLDQSARARHVQAEDDRQILRPCAISKIIELGGHHDHMRHADATLALLTGNAVIEGWAAET